MARDNSFLDRVLATYTPSVERYTGYSDHWPAIQRAAESTIALLEAKAPARILDLACGCGASTAAMAILGFEVVGIDCTPASLEFARRMSAEKGARVEWLCQDMRQLSYRDEFDYVCLCDVIFGIFESREEDMDLISRIAQALRPNGRCLFEVYNKEFAIPRGVEGFLFYDQSQDRFVNKDPNSAKISGIRLYTHAEWNQMLNDHGLGVIKMDGWGCPDDPPPPPWRADFIVAEKRSPEMNRREAETGRFD